MSNPQRRPQQRSRSRLTSWVIALVLLAVALIGGSYATDWMETNGHADKTWMVIAGALIVIFTGGAIVTLRRKPTGNQKDGRNS